MNKRLYVSDAVVRRLPGYYRHLRELEAQGQQRTSSRELSQRMGFTASQIRQDLNCFGGFGQQGYGYHVTELKQSIGEILGLNRKYHLVIAGAGNIGRAIANYPSFRREGFQIHAIFDASPALVGVEMQGVQVQHIDQLEAWLHAHTVDIGVLAVPMEAARAVAERLVDGGVRALWNFTPVDLVTPPEVTVKNVHLSDSLYALTFRMGEKEMRE